MKDDKLKSSLIKILETSLKDFPGAPIAFKFWDGSIFNPGSGTPLLVVHLKDPEKFIHLLVPPDELKLAEAYFMDIYDLEGDLGVAVEIGDALGRKKWDKKELAKIAGSAFSLGLSSLVSKTGNSIRKKKHSIESDRQAVGFAYNTSNEFYRLWLDKQMIYSGGYFPSRSATVDEAQEHKLDTICKMLQLKEGDELLDIGCGWGALTIFAAGKYGARVTGVTLSFEQQQYATAKITELGMQDKCKVILSDYREVNEEQKFDKIASVEMLHHVGEEVLPEYFRKIRKLLKPGGISYQLAITSMPSRGKYKSPAFADKYFMPDYHIVPISTYLKHAEEQGFEICDLENIREHYYLTAKQWLERLEKSHTDALNHVNEFTYRVNRLSLFLMMTAFQKGMMGFYQFIMIDKKSDLTSLPLNRKR
ncbi:MAG: class I SAM-dependent methyltransferase [Ignavibacteriaceae bacterium]|nr:class I SAM-dependent methyltransferase [Ignavibacteriaceae bacterium]